MRKYLSILIVVVLTVGLGLTIYVSQHQTNTQQHASANFSPPDGMGIYESCAPYASWCFTNLDTFAQGGMKLVLNYTVFEGKTTLTDVTNYAARAQQDNIKIIWSLKDLWSGANISLFPEMAKESGCTTTSCLGAWLVNRVKNFPATWGYYIADEPTSSQYNAVLAFSNLVHTGDPNHPRLIVKLDVLQNGYAPNAAALSQFTPAAEVLGEDWYPVAYRQNINNTSAIANEVQYIANTYHKGGVMTLEVNAGNSSDGTHATAYPTQSQMAQMLLLTLQNSQPRMVLWYWYPGISSTQWSNLVAAIHEVLPPSVPTNTPVPPTNTSVPPMPTTKPTPTSIPKPTPTAVPTKIPTAVPTITVVGAPIIKPVSPVNPTSVIYTTGKPSIIPISTGVSPTSSTQSQIVGDINGDGVVTILDYNLLLSCYGSRFGTSTCLVGKKADLNGDGKVDGVDYNIFLRAFSNH